MSCKYYRVPIQNKKVSEYDQEMTQSHAADKPRTPLGGDTEYCLARMED